MLVAAGLDITVNASLVSHMRWQSPRDGELILIITMTDGSELRVKHQPFSMFGTDARKVEAAIIAAANG